MAGDRVCLKAREIFEGYRKSKIDWKKELHDFLHQVLDKADYSFIPNDRRYSYTDLIIPMFHFEEEDSVGNIWFCVDASGSITKRELTVLFGEVRQALLQFRHFKGKVSFFDWDVTEPVEFESEEDLEKCRPAGGGGTSFRSIFWYMKKHMTRDLPEAVVVMTDGYAEFPQESETLGIPVLWIIIDSEVQPPWGKVIRIKGDDLE